MKFRRRPGSRHITIDDGTMDNMWLGNWRNFGGRPGYDGQDDGSSFNLFMAEDKKRDMLESLGACVNLVKNSDPDDDGITARYRVKVRVSFNGAKPFVAHVINTDTNQETLLENRDAVAILDRMWFDRFSADINVGKSQGKKYSAVYCNELWVYTSETVTSAEDEEIC